MSDNSQNLSLGEAASQFLATLETEERGASQQEINKFVRWFGRERPLTGIAAAEVANYAERLSISDTDYIRKLEMVRAFLTYTRKEGLGKNNLATHLKARKDKSRVRSSSRRRASPGAESLTRQGHTELEAELAVLQSKRLVCIDEIRNAAADKDFRENVPLAAAKEQMGLLEGRIRELEETLKSAVIVDEKNKTTLTVDIGDSFILSDLESGEELRFTLVGPREVNPTKGKVSGASPVGRAVIGRGQGAIVEVAAPVGKLRYQVKQIER